MTARPRASRLRICLLGTSLLLAVIVVVALLSPWWWPAVIRGRLQREGITFSRFEKLTYSRFALHDLKVDQPSVAASAARVEADSPLAWAYNAVFAKPGVVLIDKWRVELRPTASPSPQKDPAAIDGWPSLRSQLNETLATLKRWLPEAHATSGEIVSGKQNLSIAAVHWLASEGKLQADDLSWRGQKLRAELRWFASTGQLSFFASTADRQWSASLNSDGDAFSGQLQLWQQPVDVRAIFPARGWTPKEAELTATRLAVPGAAVRLGQLYSTLLSEARLSWKEAQFTWELRAEGQPLRDQTAPPLRLDLAGRGDPTSLRIERFDISSPGTNARLLAPIALGREMEILSGASQFSIESDLAQFPGGKDLTGKITGRVLVEPTTEGEPRLIATLEARDVIAPELHIKQALFEAEQSGGLLRVKSARLSFADDSVADVKGVWDWRNRTLSDGVLEGDIKPAAFARWLPASLTFSRFNVIAQAQGRWPELTHSGTLEIQDLVAGTPKPLAAKGQWSGSGAVAESIELDVTTGDSSASLQGRLTRAEVLLSAARLTLPDAPPFELTQPARIRWLPSLEVENMDLVGGDAHLAVLWSTIGARRTKIDTAHFRSEWLRDFLPPIWPAWQIESFVLDGTWPKGHLEGATRLIGQVQIAPEKHARIEIDASSQSGGTRVERFEVNDDDGPVLAARGSAPLLLTPDAAPFWKLDPEGNWSLIVETTPDSPFWIAQAEASGVTLRSPRLSARIEGSVKKPDARIDIQAGEISFVSRRLPPISQLDARLVLDAGHVNLERFSVLVSGQNLTASGRATVAPGRWPELARNPRDLWSGDAEAKLSLPGIDLAAFGTFLPDAFAPTGTLNGQLTLRASGDINGALKIADISTHPISPFGSFNQITGEIVFNGRSAELKSLTALASGQPVRLGGDVAFPQNKPPTFNIFLEGKNLPLARQTGLLIRGDLDLQVKTGDEGRTTLGGSVNLHDSLFLRDVRSLVPTRGGSPASRPPYFSVTAPTFRDWALALKVTGSRAIKLRTPLFNGIASGAFDLTGTLHEPIAVGQVTFDEGSILLPFAALRLRSGSIRLTRADPYSPQISLVAESRSLGYDVRMELNGPVSDPALVFSSSPPLSSEQVLLMVMAGETPRTDISYTGSERATRIGRYLGKSLLSGFFGDPSSAERFTITSGENVTERGKETYNAEYRLNERWSAIGERDEFDDYNVGFKRRVLAPKKEVVDENTR